LQPQAKEKDKGKGKELIEGCKYGMGDDSAAEPLRAASELL